jgi:polyisoprenoid-binding protein YceI
MLDLKGKWKILEDESEFTFKARTFGLFTVKGTMSGIMGEIDFNKINTDEFISLSLEPSTLNTGIEKRDEHLKSEDFLYVDEYPLIEFTGGQVELIDQEDQSYVVSGMLNIRGITHNEIIPTTFIGYFDNQNNMIEFRGVHKINRNKYDVDYTGRLIADDVEVKYTIIAEKK